MHPYYPSRKYVHVPFLTQSEFTRKNSSIIKYIMAIVFSVQVTFFYSTYSIPRELCANSSIFCDSGLSAHSKYLCLVIELQSKHRTGLQGRVHVAFLVVLLSFDCFTQHLHEIWISWRCQECTCTCILYSVWLFHVDTNMLRVLSLEFYIKVLWFRNEFVQITLYILTCIFYIFNCIWLLKQ
jgi:hypothetical protein